MDTGSQVVLISDDLISKHKQIEKPIIFLTGLNGKDHPVPTSGNIFGNFTTDDNSNWISQIHLVKRAHAGEFDGYIGLDFLKKHRAIIDLHNGTLQLHAPITDDGKIINTSDSTQPTDSTAKTSNESNSHINNDAIAKTSKNVRFNIQNEIPISKFEITKCLQAKTCHSCQQNEDKMQKHWNYSSVVKPNAQTTESTNQQDESVNEYLRQLEEIHINDYDSDIVKIRKINKHGIKLPKHAIKYLDAFESSENLVPTKTICNFSSQPTMSREQFIYTNLPKQHCSQEELTKIETLIMKHEQQFHVEGDKLPKTDIIKHRIHLKPDTPILYTRQFRLSEKMASDVQKETRNLFNNGIITKSTSAFNSPAFMVPKKDENGGITDQRFVIDYRTINEHTHLRDFPIPRVEQLIDNFSRCKFFSCLDIKSAYHQIELAEEHREFTAFTVNYNKFHWNRMPFGLCGAPLTMQEAVTTLLHDLLDRGVSVYIDDVSIVAEDIETHDRLLAEVFNRLEKHNFQVKISKCVFYAKQVEFLGFIVTPGHVKPNPNKVEAILKLAEPNTRKKLQKFLGMCNYYRRFIRAYSDITRPLNQKTSIKKQYNFDQQCREAFNKLKQILANDVTLKIVDYNQRFYVSCDASDKAISAVLAQGKPPHDRPIQFFSKALTHPQEKWIIMERECLALVSAVKAFSNYLQGREFTLITDNLALVYIYKHNDPYSKLFRMKMELVSYKYSIIYRKGAYNKVADALTRLDYEEEMDISEFLSKYSEDLQFKQIRAITRSMPKAHQEPLNHNTLTPFVTSKPGFATEDSEYDCIFSVITSTNKELIAKTTDKIKNQTMGLTQLNDNHFFATINPRGTTNEELKRLINAMIKECEEKELVTIAINTDLHPKHRFIIKYLIENNQSNSNLHVTIHADEIIKLSDTRHIKSALDMHHKTHGGAHLNIQQMIEHMKHLYQWNDMVDDIKKHVTECTTCAKSSIEQMKIKQRDAKRFQVPTEPSECSSIQQSSLEYKLDLAETHNYDCIFSIISASNNQLISKITNTNEFKPNMTLTSINQNNHIALVQASFEDEIKSILITIFTYKNSHKYGPKGQTTFHIKMAAT